MLKKLTKTTRNSHVYAYCLGFYERRRYGIGAYRTHRTDMAWNDAYDRGQGLSD